MLNTIQNSQIQTSWQLAQASVDSLAQAIQSGRSEALFTYLQTMAKFINFPHLRDEHRAVLQAIGSLGPDVALKQHAFTNKGDPGKWRNRRNIRPILNPDAIATAMGLPKKDVHRYLCQMRPILRDMFNRDGSLFSS